MDKTSFNQLRKGQRVKVELGRGNDTHWYNGTILVVRRTRRRDEVRWVDIDLDREGQARVEGRYAEHLVAIELI